MADGNIQSLRPEGSHGLLPLSDHRGQDKGCFLTAKYRTYFACQYQRHRWHYPQAQDHLCRLLDPAVHLALGVPVDRPRSILPLGSLWTGLPSRTNRTLWSRGAYITPRPRRTHRFTCRLPSFTDLAVNIPHIYLHRNFSSLIFGACHSKRKNIFYRWRDLAWYDQHLSRPQSACFLVEEI